jgi:2'-5' RNA ligase
VRLNLLRPERPPPPPKVHAFLAVHYDEEFLDEVAALAERLRGDPRLSDAIWVSPSGLDTTIHFFLDTSEAQRRTLVALVEELAASAAAAGTATSALVRATKLHGLPSSDSAHFLILDVEAVEDVEGGPGSLLGTLQARVEAASIALGYAPSRRPFPTHVKLARVTPAVAVSDHAEAARSLPRGRLTAISLHVSSPNQVGDVQNRYDVIASAPFRMT